MSDGTSLRSFLTQRKVHDDHARNKKSVSVGFGLSGEVGTFNPATGDLNISSNDGNTVFVGTAGSGSGGMSGTIQDSAGNPVGGFSGVFTTDANAAATYCGIAISGQSDAFNVNVDADGNLERLRRRPLDPRQGVGALPA